MFDGNYHHDELDEFTFFNKFSGFTVLLRTLRF